MSDTRDALSVAKEAARSAGAIALQGFRGRHEITSKGGTDIVTQYDHAAEEAALAVIRRAFPDHAVLAEESGQSKPLTSRTETSGGPALLWMVDPIDGTHNYATQLPFWCVSVAAVDLVSGTPEVGVVYDPLHEELFSAARGQGTYLNGERIHTGERSDLRQSIIAYDIGHGDNLAPRMVSLIPIVQPRVAKVRHLGSAALAMTYVAAGRLDGFYHLMLNPWDVAAAMLLILEAGGVVTDWHGRPRGSGEGPVIAAGAALHADLLSLIHSAGES